MKKIQNALAKTKSKKLSNQACFLGTRKSKKIYMLSTLFKYVPIEVLSPVIPAF